MGREGTENSCEKASVRRRRTSEDREEEGPPVASTEEVKDVLSGLMRLRSS